MKKTEEPPTLFELNIRARKLLVAVCHTDQLTAQLVRRCTKRYLGEPLELRTANVKQLAALVDVLEPIAAQRELPIGRA
jgi:hypothetical protein